MPGTIIKKPTAENYDTQIAQINARVDNVEDLIEGVKSYYIIDTSYSSEASIKICSGSPTGQALTASEIEALFENIAEGPGTVSLYLAYVGPESSNSQIVSVDVNENLNFGSDTDSITITGTKFLQTLTIETPKLEVISLNFNIAHGATPTITYGTVKHHTVQLTQVT